TKGGPNQELACGPVSLQIDPGHDAFPEQEGQNIVAETALGSRGVDLYPIVESEQLFQAAPLEDQRVKRAQQRPAFGPAWQSGLNVPVGFPVPAANGDALQPACLEKALHRRLTSLQRGPKIVGKTPDRSD